MNTPRKLINIFWLQLLCTVVLSLIMQWIARGFRYASTGETFSIFDVELADSFETLQGMLSDMSNHTRSLVQYQLLVDFPFMAVIYPGIATLLLYCRAKSASATWRIIFTITAAIQIVPWLFDVLENLQLLCWLNDPDYKGDYPQFHFFVLAKFGIALFSFFFIALPGAVTLRLKKRNIEE